MAQPVAREGREARGELVLAEECLALARDVVRALAAAKAAAASGAGPAVGASGSVPASPLVSAAPPPTEVTPRRFLPIPSTIDAGIQPTIPPGF